MIDDKELMKENALLYFAKGLSDLGYSFVNTNPLDIDFEFLGERLKIALTELEMIEAGKYEKGNFSYVNEGPGRFDFNKSKKPPKLDLNDENVIAAENAMFSFYKGIVYLAESILGNLSKIDLKEVKDVMRQIYKEYECLRNGDYDISKYYFYSGDQKNIASKRN